MKQQFIPRNLEQIRAEAIRQRQLREEQAKNADIVKRKSVSPTSDLSAIRDIMNSSTTKQIEKSFFDVDTAEKELKDYLQSNSMYDFERTVFKFHKDVFPNQERTAPSVRVIAKFIESVIQSYKQYNSVKK